MNVAPGAWRYAIGPLAAAPFALLINVPAAVALAALGAAVLAFFRDPDRTPPVSGVVAPADGKVSVLREEGERVRAGIFMNVWNVHVIRAPDDGAVSDVEHTSGAHRPAFSKDSDRNERVHVRFETDRSSDPEPPSVADSENVKSIEPHVDSIELDGETTTPVEEVTMIAGAFARRITPYVESGESVRRGDRIGHIAFGSRVDVVFAPSVSIDDVAVEPGESTTAGETPLLEPGRSVRSDAAATEIETPPTGRDPDER